MCSQSNKIITLSDTELLIRALENFKLSLLDIETLRLKADLEILEAIDHLKGELSNMFSDK